MSDYLGRLVASSTDPASMLRPRPASRFEPAPSGALALVETMRGEAIAFDIATAHADRVSSTEWPARAMTPIQLLRDSQPAEYDPPAPGTSRRRDSLAAPRRESESTYAVPALEKRITNDAVVQSERASHKPAFVETAPRDPGDVQPMSPRPRTQAVDPRRDVELQTVAPPPLIEPVRQELRTARPELAAHREPTMETLPATRHSPEANRARVALEDVIGPVGPMPDSGPETSLPDSEPSPVARPAGRSTPASIVVEPAVKRIVRGEPITSLPAARQPEPIVNVTIGRIEVRAVPAPAPSTRERVKPPVMSLEQYLRRRDGRSGA